MIKDKTMNEEKEGKFYTLEEHWDKSDGECTIVLFILMNEEKMIGKGEVYWFKEQQLPVLYGLYVNKDHRNKGIGRKIQKEREEYIKLKFSKPIKVLLFVEKNRDDLIEFHRKSGYEIDEKATENEEDESKIWMIKNLK